ncbi:MAG: hypothetical protein IJ341_02795 [Bacteroidales bacterium]|nr:hypothetical protein [Bacteroidales bacterium]
MPEMYSVVVFNCHEKKTEKIVSPFTHRNALEYMQNEASEKYRFLRGESLIFKGDEAILIADKSRQWIWNIVECEENASYDFSTIQVDTPNGYFRASKSSDPNYPGIDIDFIDAKEIAGKANDRVCRPRVLFECPKDGELRVLVWADPNNEDYTGEITFPLFYK